MSVVIESASRPPVSVDAPADDTPDLSFVDHPIQQQYQPFPPPPEIIRKFMLTPEQIAFYAENGYLTNVKVLSDAECDDILADYNQFLKWDSHGVASGKNDAASVGRGGMHLFHEFHSNQSGDPNNVLSHALGHWRVTPAFHDIVFHPAVTVGASQLMATAYVDTTTSGAVTADGTLCAVQFWHDQLFAKPARYGGNVAWHQDYSYWTRTAPMNHMTVHIALDEQTVENGSLFFVPKSQHWTRTDANGLRTPLPVTDFDFKDMESIQTVLTEEERAAFKPVPALLKRGHASFHHPLTVHGSFPNRTDKPRRAAVLNYFVRGTKSQTDEPLLLGVPIVPRGQTIQGRFFPTVFDPEWLQQQ